MLDWLIVGGGLHGSLIAKRLAYTNPQAQIAIIDPAKRAIDSWNRRADACGMYYLRSAEVHHLDIAPSSLAEFAQNAGFGEQHFLGPYRRPTRPVFEAHCLQVTQQQNRIQACVAHLEKQANHWIATDTQANKYKARRIVLALGPQTLHRPAWGQELAHVFATGFAPQLQTSKAKEIIIIGGGITAGQLAVLQAKAGHDVTLVSRHPLRVETFDGDPCYIGSRCLDPFLQQSHDTRRALLKQARNPGTLPPEIYDQLAACFKTPKARWIRGNVTQLTDNGLILDNGCHIQADEIILATGYAPDPGALLRQVGQQYGLKMDAMGNADINSQLEWAPGLHLIGKPASLELGPVSGNIPGARIAARRLAPLA